MADLFARLANAFAATSGLDKRLKEISAGVYAEVTAPATDGVSDSLTTTASATSAADIVSVSNVGFNGGSFQITANASANTVTFEQSNDGATWGLLQVVGTAATGSNPSSTQTAVGIYTYVSSAAFVRARVSTYIGGTTSVSLSQKRNAPPVTGISLGTSSAAIGNSLRYSGFTDSSTVLAGAATFTGSSRASLSTATRFAATVFADQAGTLFIELSTDTGATWRVVDSVAVAASVPQQRSVIQTGLAGAATLYRVRYLNGATLQTAFQLSSAFIA